MSAAFVCPNCEETTFPDKAGTVVCSECGATIETTDKSPAAWSRLRDWLYGWWLYLAGRV